MNRNVSIVIALLVLVVIAGYLVWLRSKAAPVVSPKSEEQVQVTPTVQPTMTVSPSATPKEATGSTKQKVSTPGAVKK